MAQRVETKLRRRWPIPGGLGQRMVVGNREKAEFAIFGTFDRVKNPARGRDGGKPGATGSLTLTSGKKLKGMGRQVIPMGEELIIEMPGGGGLSLIHI